MSAVIFDAPDCLATDAVGEEPESADSPDCEGLPASETIATATEVSGDPMEAVTVGWDSCSPRSDADDTLDQIWNAEQECRRKESHVEYLKEQIKEAKASLEQAVIRLRGLCSDHDQTRSTPPTMDNLGKQWDARTADAIGCDALDDTTPGAAGAPATTDKPDESWRAVPLAELLATPIKKLGPKKIEALTDLCPTLGDFENLRSRVGRDATEFHELLPKGIGLETASELEERFLNWIAKNASGGNGKPESNILRRATEINTGSINCLDHKHPEGKQWHESGWQAWSREVKLEECPYVPGPEQDDWIRGWLGHELVERYEANPDDPNEVETPAKATDVSLDDL